MKVCASNVNLAIIIFLNVDIMLTLLAQTRAKSSPISYQRKLSEMRSKSCDLYSGAVWREWGTNCGKFCDEIGRPVRCDWWTYGEGCFCPTFYYRDANYNCVPDSQCPQSGVTQRPEISVPEKNREKSWDILGPKKGGEKIIESVKSQQPVRPYGESKHCPPNEEPSDCGDRCYEGCGEMYKDEACDQRCVVGCFCLQGYFRDKSGVCVPEEDCYATGPTTPFDPRLYPVDDERIENALNRYRSDHIDRSPPEIRRDLPQERQPEISRDHRQVKQEIIPQEIRRDLLSKQYKPPPPSELRRDIAKTPENDREISPEVDTKYHSKSNKPRESSNMVRNSDRKCEPNEEYSSCGSRCYEACEHIGEERVCGKDCETGCFCLQGYYRKDTVCVPEEQCPQNINDKFDKFDPSSIEVEHPVDDYEDYDYDEPKMDNDMDSKMEINSRNRHQTCRKFEEYSECGNHCLQSCRFATDRILCPSACVSGCFCGRGLFRDSTGDCVPVRKCRCDREPRICSDPNEWYTKCGTECGRTCADIGQQSCPAVCDRGCFCAKGYVRNDDGVCVRPHECPKIYKTLLSLNYGKKLCGLNEAYSECGTSCGEGCRDIDRSVACVDKCETGCFCADGYYRDDNGVCVPAAKCPRKRLAVRPCNQCRINEYYSDCGNDCGSLCSHLAKPVRCGTVCGKGCFCKHGFYRDGYGECVPRRHCLRLLFKL